MIIIETYKISDVKPFLKWVGGKRQLLSDINKYKPKNYNTLIEPFVGGGSVFMALNPKHIIINDINEELINTYQVVKNEVLLLIEALKIHEQNHSKDYFYKVRSWDRDGTIDNISNIERAARFIYLNKTCFNGLYRVNKKGEYNTPFGSYKNSNIVNETVLKADSLFFNQKELQINHGDFEKVIYEAKPGDFIYLDPPYAPITDNGLNFVAYTQEGFTYDDQKRLYKLFKMLDEKGCYVMLSNASTPFIHELYKDYKNTTQIVKANRTINANSKKRGKVDEVLIMNYIV